MELKVFCLVIFYFTLGLKVNFRSCKRSNNSFGERRSGIDFYRKPVQNFRCFYQSTLLATNIASQRGDSEIKCFFILGRCNFSETILRNPISNLEYLHKVSLFLCNKTPFKSEQNKQFSFSDYKERKERNLLTFYMKRTPNNEMKVIKHFTKENRTLLQMFW